MSRILSTGTGAHPSDPRARLIEYEQFIDRQIATTRAHVKSAEIFGALLHLAAVVVAYLLITAVADHWLVTGGLGRVSRVALWLVLVAIVGHVCWTRLIPAVFRPVNPAYAAQAIERTSPGLKNRLLNFLFFRRDRDQLPAAIYETVEEQAAQGLAHTDPGAAVDRTGLLKTGYVLLAILAIGCLYKVFSPKDPLPSAGRILMPWSRIAPPTRVRIGRIEPGSTSIPEGEVVEVSADIEGLGPGDSVALHYSLAGPPTAAGSLEMGPSSVPTRFSVRFPDSDAGMRTDAVYRIEAGDALSEPFTLRVTPAPYFFVRTVTYEYPPYTGLETRTVDREGDLKAIEGTRVTIVAQANSTVQSAYLDFGCDTRRDPGRDPLMNPDGLSASVAFTLLVNEDRSGPRYDRYQLLMKDATGQSNRQPVQHRIEVIPDLAPEIEILAPSADAVEVPWDGRLAVEIHASDPDFALDQVDLLLEASGKQPWRQPLLEKSQPGQFVGRCEVSPRQIGLKPGDVADLWAVARDVKLPDPNETSTRRKRVVILEPERPEASAPESGQPGSADGAQSPKPQEDQSDPRRKIPRDRPQDDDSGQPDPQRRGQPQEDARQDPSPENGSSGGQGGGGESSDASDSSETAANGNSKGSPSEGSRTPPSDSESKPSSSGRQGTPSEPGSESPGGETQDAQTAQSQPNTKPDPSGRQGKPGDRDTEPSGGEKRESQPVASDGSDDGSVFREVLKQLEERQQGRSDRQQTDSQDRSGSGQETGAENAAKSDSLTQRGAGDSSGSQEQKSQGFEGQEKESASDDAAKESPRTAQQGPKSDEPSEPKEPNRPGSESGQEGDPSQERPGPTPSSSAKPRGGQAGAGQGDPNQSLPEPQQPASPKDKTGDEAGDRQSAEPEQATSPGTSRHESDSQGDTSGDQQGGGKSGGGQQARSPGQGAAGSQQAADEGADAAPEGGSGPDSRPGADSSTQATPGKSGKSPAGGDSSAGPQAGDKSSESPAAARGSDQGPRTPDGSRQGTEGFGPPAGGGGSGNGSSPTAGEQETPPGDPANLEYTRRATDLVLEHLKDQLAKDQVDPKLLERLGWTPDDLKRFVDRWEQLFSQAQQVPGQGEGTSQLSEALKSLGLGKRRIVRSAEAADDRQQGLRESLRSSPPLEYQEQLRAYLKGTSRYAPSASGPADGSGDQ